MSNIPGYDRLLKVYESLKSAVFRASRQDDTQPVVLKVLKNEYPSFEELTQYKQEYEITRNLNHSGTLGIIGVYD